MKAHHEIPLEEKAPGNLGLPFNISATAEASDFNLVHSLSLPKPIKNHIHRKSGCDFGLGELRKILKFPYISATAEASNFKIGTLMGYAKAHQKIPHRKKVDVALCYRSSQTFWDSLVIFVQWLKQATSNLACSWDWPRPTIKTTNREKVGVALG